MFEKATSSEATKIEYTNIFRRKQAQCAREKRINPDQLTAQDFVRWLISGKLQMSKATWRLYKAASIHGLSTRQEEVLKERGHPDEALQLAIVELMAEPQTGAIRKGTQGPALKKKTVKEEFLDEITAYLETNGGVWNQRAATYIRATIRVGLRPIEWGAVSLTHPFLVVQNAKHTNGRAAGKERWIPITAEGWNDWLTERAESHIHTEEIRARYFLAREKAPASMWRSAENEIEANLKEIATWRSEHPEEPFRRYNDQVAQAIARACKALRPKGSNPMSMYTLRHQFLANLKNVLPDVGIAELAGHITARTAKKSYSKAQQGYLNYRRVGAELRAGRETMPAFRRPLASQRDDIA